MNILTSLLTQHPLEIYCALTIAFTFSATLLPLPGESVAVVMVFIPALRAICLTALSEGKTGVRSLLGKLVQGRISLKWVVIALGLARLLRLTMSLLALGVGMISTIQLRPGGPEPYVLLVVVFFVFAIPEELRWRGYALPKLLERCSPLAAGLIVGVLWGSLHLALLLPGVMNESAPSLPTLLALVGGSVLFTWLYVNSGGNIILTMLFPAAQSFFVIVNEGITLEQQMWLLAAVYLATALIVAMFTGPSLTLKSVDGITPLVQASRGEQLLARK